ncbi:helix-turn-helix domain-containing protein [bacterium]|nr:helix-turn-helix domain-containing protein [bacterium]
MNKLVSKNLICSEKDGFNWLDTKQAARYLCISEGNLRTKVCRGEIPVQGKLGRNNRFDRNELDRFIRSGVKSD